MHTIKATDLRRDLFGSLDQLARDREPVEIRRFKRPVAVLVPSPDLPPSKRKPVLNLEAIASFCKRYQIASFSLFGSVLRSDFDEKSDVDVLIDVQSRFVDFHEECRMVDELEVMFGRKVDLLTTDALSSPRMNPRRRASISASACKVYDASS